MRLGSANMTNFTNFLAAVGALVLASSLTASIVLMIALVDSATHTCACGRIKAALVLPVLGSG